MILHFVLFFSLLCNLNYLASFRDDQYRMSLFGRNFVFFFSERIGENVAPENHLNRFIGLLEIYVVKMVA